MKWGKRFCPVAKLEGSFRSSNTEREVREIENSSKNCIWLLLVVSHFVMSDSATPWTAACQASRSFTISYCLLKLVSIELVMPSNHLILCHPLLLLPSIFPSIRINSNEWALHISWPKYWSFSFSISPSNEYSGLITFRIDLFDFLAVQVTLKGLLQHHSSKAQLFSAVFFIIQLSHPYMTTGKTRAWVLAQIRGLG